jgi:hypothetical protein
MIIILPKSLIPYFLLRECNLSLSVRRIPVPLFCRTRTKVYSIFSMHHNVFKRKTRKTRSDTVVGYGEKHFPYIQITTFEIPTFACTKILRMNPARRTYSYSSPKNWCCMETSDGRRGCLLLCS